MYRLIKKASGKAPSILIILASMLMLQVAGCSDSGSVGGGLPGTGSQIESDSLEVSGVQVETIVPFSGAINFFSVGQFQDPLFGDLNAVGYIKPVLPAKDNDFFFGSNMTLQLAINDNTIYGDTLSAARYDLIELAEIYRGTSFRLNDELEFSPAPVVGSFTVQNNEDSVAVSLSSRWVSKYREFYNSEDADRDSLYRRQFLGLAIVPQNSAKIISINAVESRFRVIESFIGDPEEADVDTLNIGFRESAYGLDRTNVPANDPSTSKIYSTLEQVLKFDFDFSFENLGSRNITRAELLFYRDNLALNQSLAQIGASAMRPMDGNLRLYLLEGDELPQSIEAGTPIATGSYQPEDEAYHINITQAVRTQFFNNLDSDQMFYVTFGQNNGIIRSTVLFNSQAGAANQPKVIITSVNTENN